MEEKVNYIKTNPKADIIINDIEIDGTEDIDNYKGFAEQTAKFYRKNSGKKIFKKFFEGNMIATFSIVMIKTSILKSLDFNSPISAWIDWWLWCQVGAKYPIFYVDKKLTVWNRHGESYIVISKKETFEKKTFLLIT